MKIPCHENSSLEMEAAKSKTLLQMDLEIMILS